MFVARTPHEQGRSEIPVKGKDAILLYSVPTELPLAAGEGVHDAQWMPCQGRRLTSVASFPLIAALKLLSGPRWSFDHNENMLRLYICCTSTLFGGR